MQIIKFKQLEHERVAQAWERMKLMLNNCLTHGLKLWMIIQKFYAGLNFSSQNLLDSATGGTFMEITLDEATHLLDNIMTIEKAFSCNFLPKKDEDLKMIGSAPLDSLFCKFESVDKGTVHDPTSIRRRPKFLDSENRVDFFSKSGHEDVKTLSSDAPTLPLDFKDFNYDNCSLIEQSGDPIDVNFIARNNFNNNTYRGNYRPFPNNCSNNFGGSYGNPSYNNNRNTYDLENSLK
jgi:hypothetical protein